MDKKRSSPLSKTSLFFALLFLLGFVYLDIQTIQNRPLSKKSMSSLEEMSANYQMTVEDLFSPEGSKTIAQITKADLFTATPEANDNKGLLVRLEAGNVLLFAPAEALEDEELQEIAELYLEPIPEVESVELDQDLVLNGEPVYKWTLFPEEPLVELSETEVPLQENVRVAVIDSGMDVSHPLFKDHPIEKGWNTFNNDENPYDDVGHGTHVAGIIAQNSSHVTLIPYKIASATGGRLSNVVEGIHQAIEDEVDVLNMSFGIFSPSETLEDLIQEAQEQGIVVVAAAGNEGKDQGFYPASYKESIAVASVDGMGNALPRSNYGAWISVAANGSSIYSSLPDNDYGTKTGTSQSAAFVSAAVVNFLYEHPEETFEKEELLKELTKDSEIIAKGKLAGVPVLE